MQILVVSDDEQTRTNLGILLSRAGDEVIDVDNGERGLDAYRASMPHVVFVDARMPGMDGVEFTRRVLREFPEAKIVVMAAKRVHGAPDPLAIARNLGAIETLRKPFDAAEAFRVLDEILD